MAFGKLKYGQIKVGSRRMAHVQIDPQLLRSQTGQFHSSRVLNSGQKFTGCIYADGDGAKHLEDLVGDGRELFIGRGRSRGQGQVRLTISKSESESDAEERISTLNDVAADKFPNLGGKLLF